MRTRLLIAVCCLLARLAMAHVGSPNVFFQGDAGPHRVLVVIRPPGTLPGIATVDVRLENDTASHVAVRADFQDSAVLAQPAAAPATPDPANPRLFHAEVWLLRRGSYAVEIEVSGPAGQGKAEVPLGSVATRTPTLSPGLGSFLAALGALLVAAAIWIAYSAGGRRAAIVASLLLSAGLLAVAYRWREMDQTFRSDALDRPVPLNATARIEEGRCILRLSAAEVRGGLTWDALVTDHGKLMHLFLVSEENARAFAHLHPVRRDVQTFEGVLPPLPPGPYRIFAETTFATGASQTLAGRVTLPASIPLPPQALLTAADDVLCTTLSSPEENAPKPTRLDADDAWNDTAPAPTPATTQTLVNRLPDGGSLVFYQAGDLVADREATLHFEAFDSRGQRLPLRPYMGMAGHAAVCRSDATVFAHLHPAGSFAMAAQQLIAFRTDGTVVQNPTPQEGPGVSFPYAFPQAGEYRIWVQVRSAERVLTGVFDVQVKAAP